MNLLVFPLLFATFWLSGHAGAAPQTWKRSSPNGGVVEAELTQFERGPDRPVLSMSRWQNTTVTPKVFQDSLTNRLTYYAMNISIGFPPQYFMVQVDTGSSDLWVPGDAIRFDGFNPNASTTFNYVHDSFFIKYVKDFARGIWGSDTVSLPGAGLTIHGQEFGIAMQAPDASIGILGVGPVESESTHHRYLNLPSSLVKQGTIKKNAYSMYMRNHMSKKGKILFGGDDRAKHGELATLKMTSTHAITVNVSSVQLDNSTAWNSSMEVLLDTGTSWTYLPDNIVHAIAKKFHAKYNRSLKMYVVNHREVLRSSHPGVTFRFNRVTVNMPKSELFWPLAWFTLDAGPYYVLTVLPNSMAMGYSILGDSFLRSAYVVYNLDERVVRIGEYIDTEESDIVEI